MRHLSIGTRLYLAFGAICALIALVGLALASGLGGIKDTWSGISATTLVRLEVATSGRIAVGDAVQNFKNLVLRGGENAQRFEKNITEIGKAVKDYRATGALSAEESKLLDEIDRDAGSYLAAMKKVVDLKAAGAEITQIDSSIKGADRPLASAFEALLKMNREATHAADAGMSQQISGIEWRAYGLSAAALVLSLVLATAITRSITVPLHRAVVRAAEVAAGDLSRDSLETRGDEIGALMHAMHDMSQKLAQVVGTVRGGADAIALATSEIASGNQDLANRTEEQASSLQRASSELVQLTEAVRQYVDQTRQASDHVQHATEVAARGGRTVSEVVHTMDSISASSRKIVEIIAVIDGIAFQTNILALNAAVEAARAGEQGKGFAVVASEVRSLAQRSASAAKEIKELIDASVHEVIEGTRQVKDAGTTMTDLVSSVQRVASIMTDMLQLSQDQDHGIAHASHAVSEIDGVMQQNAALVEQAAAASVSLREQADRLVGEVNYFRTAPAASSGGGRAFARHRALPA